MCLLSRVTSSRRPGEDPAARDNDRLSSSSKGSHNTCSLPGDGHYSNSHYSKRKSVLEGARVPARRPGSARHRAKKLAAPLVDTEADPQIAQRCCPRQASREGPTAPLSGRGRCPHRQAGSGRLGSDHHREREASCSGVVLCITQLLRCRGGTPFPRRKTRRPDRVLRVVLPEHSSNTTPLTSHGRTLPGGARLSSRQSRP